MTLGGVPYAPEARGDARAAGVAMIYQELALAPHLTVEANIMLGQERVRAGLIRADESIDGWSPRPSSCWTIPRSSPDAVRPRPERRRPAARRGGPGPGLRAPG